MFIVTSKLTKMTTILFKDKFTMVKKQVIEGKNYVYITVTGLSKDYVIILDNPNYDNFIAGLNPNNNESISITSFQ